MHQKAEFLGVGANRIIIYILTTGGYIQFLRLVSLDEPQKAESVRVHCILLVAIIILLLFFNIATLLVMHM
jgi:hypothetical protein